MGFGDVGDGIVGDGVGGVGDGAVGDGVFGDCVGDIGDGVAGDLSDVDKAAQLEMVLAMLQQIINIKGAAANAANIRCMLRPPGSANPGPWGHRHSLAVPHRQGQLALAPRTGY